VVVLVVDLAQPIAELEVEEALWLEVVVVLSVFP